MQRTHKQNILKIKGSALEHIFVAWKCAVMCFTQNAALHVSVTDVKQKPCGVCGGCGGRQPVPTVCPPFIHASIAVGKKHNILIINVMEAMVSRGEK